MQHITTKSIVFCVYSIGYNFIKSTRSNQPKKTRQVNQLRHRMWLYLKWWNTEQLDRRARTCDCIYYLDNVYEKTASNLPSDVLRQSIGPEREYRHSVEINSFPVCKYFADIHTHSIVQHQVCRRAHDTRFLQTTAMRRAKRNSTESIPKNRSFVYLAMFLWRFAIFHFTILIGSRNIFIGFSEIWWFCGF